jgi:hypothetical protein
MMSVPLTNVIPVAPALLSEMAETASSEKKMLVLYEGSRCEAHCRIRKSNLEGGRWFISNPTWDVFESDFAGEAIVGLVRGGEYPLVCYRPLREDGPISAEQYALLRADAFAIAEIFGQVPAVALLLTDDGDGLFSDPSWHSCALSVPSELTSHAARLWAEGSMELDEFGGTHGRSWDSTGRSIWYAWEEWRQLQLAVKRTPHAADFSGLGWYVEHRTPLVAEAAAPESDWEIVEMRRGEIQRVTSESLQDEESVALLARPIADAKAKEKADE